jgi:DNA-binding NtrC family response regulator
LQTPRLLLLEPDRQRVDEFRDVFEHHGFETEVALNRDVALAVLAERKMDVILIDADASDDGCGDLVEEFHLIDPGLAICVINGVKEKPKQRAIKRLGAQSYLSAPTDGDKALKAVSRVVNLS